jgi:hypothetical protein
VGALEKKIERAGIDQIEGAADPKPAEQTVEFRKPCAHGNEDVSSHVLKCGKGFRQFIRTFLSSWHCVGAPY